jgi:hypothetical protein
MDEKRLSNATKNFLPPGSFYLANHNIWYLINVISAI